MKLSSLGRAARSQAGIKVRQPVGTGYIQFPAKSDGEIDAFMRVKPQLLEELNIKILRQSTRLINWMHPNTA